MINTKKDYLFKILSLLMPQLRLFQGKRGNDGPPGPQGPPGPKVGSTQSVKINLYNPMFVKYSNLTFYIFATQGSRGFDGIQGVPGPKGHKVRLKSCKQ